MAMNDVATARVPGRLADRRRWAALAVLVGSVLLLAIDGTVLYLAVPSLTRDLAPTATQVLWIGDVYSLALAGLLVTAGTLADRIGRKKVLLTGSAAFGVASVLAAFSTSAEMLIGARLLLGVAGATIMPSTLSIIRDLFPDAGERSRAIAIWGAGSGGGLALGPLVGGALLDHFWWGSVFLVNVPVVAVFLITGALLLPESRDPAPGRFDLLSAGLSVAAITPLVYAIKHAVDQGLDAWTASSALFGLAAGVLFVRRQRRAQTPLIDVTLFRNPAFSGAVLADLIAIFALTGLLFFFSQYLQLVRGFDPLQAGLAEMPTTIAMTLVIGVVGWVVARLGVGRAVAAGLLVAAVGLLVVAAAEDANNYLWLALALLPVGLGVGLAMTLTVDAVVSAVPRHQAGAASAIAETAYELGVVLGIAVLGSVMALRYRAGLDVPDAARPAVEESAASALATLDPGSDLAGAVREAFIEAMQTTSVIAAVITAVAALVAWRTIPSGKKDETAGTGSTSGGG
ncbi:MFS transporter, DHA2 family, multidrug resistance protein [Micromonospora viridifaciens]|uniref:MFS transporter, DHA2 family, multidrug resistance protein n=1 Tax=Micromonospora viridifaciens TaxID=1881 RepID=A0A1C4XZJ6_MICVI|nr:MFS transporter [Micromonospora viridifaciens]SCF13875.1 MFS transporter, DHA2 family, multidrug resistance protein [Micromonospora viridifaciens]